MTRAILFAIPPTFDNKCGQVKSPLLFCVPDQAVAPQVLPEMKICESWCSNFENNYFVKYGHLTSLPNLDSRCSSRWARRWFACSGACFLTPCSVNLCCYAALRPFEAMSDCKSSFWEQYWFLFQYLGHTGEVLVVEEDFSRARCS